MLAEDLEFEREVWGDGKCAQLREDEMKIAELCHAHSSAMKQIKGSDLLEANRNEWKDLHVRQWKRRKQARKAAIKAREADEQAFEACVPGKVAQAVQR